MRLTLDDFARVHARPVDRAAEDLEAVDQPVAAVEKQDREYFVIARGQPHRQVVPRCVRRGHDRALPDADRERVARAGDELLERGFAKARRRVRVGGVEDRSHGRLRAPGRIAREPERPRRSGAVTGSPKATRRVEDRREQRSALTARTV